MMSDEEFDILDELYFVQSFAYIQENTQYKETEIFETLKILLEKDWIKIYDQSHKEILVVDNIDLAKNYKNFHYLATKAGLKAHTQI